MGKSKKTTTDPVSPTEERDVAPRTRRVGQYDDYSKLPVEEVRQIAAQAGVEDVAALSKSECLDAIAERGRGADAVEVPEAPAVEVPDEE